MRIDVITIFPGMFQAVLSESIVKRAQEKGKVAIHVHNLRDYTLDKHRKVDDRPFGGGSGMVMSPEPIFRAVETIKAGLKRRRIKTRVVLLSPRGRRFDQRQARRLSSFGHLIFICGHYEGIDERVAEFLADESLSIGDYVLTGGELPAMVAVDALVRLIPGVLGDKNSLNFESFEGNLLEYPQYTRPANFRDHKVPQVLLTGDHRRIEAWRRKEAIRVTRRTRPDMAKDAVSRGTDRQEEV